MAAVLKFARPRDRQFAGTDLGKLREHLDNRLGSLRTERLSWWTHWRELADYLLPSRYLWLITPNKASRGSPINQRIIDSTGTKAARVCGAGMMTGATSPARPWFRLTLDDKNLADFPAVKMYLDEVTRRMQSVMAESNFYGAFATMREDNVVFGTAPVFIEEDHQDVIRCWNAACGEYYLANDERGDVGSYYREFVYTTLQMAQKFGAENCSPTVQSAIRTGGSSLAREVKVAHAVEPNSDYVPEAPGVAGKKFRGIYWEIGSSQEHILQIRGFDENPVIAPRWDVIGNNAYGRSPGMDALPDVKQLQVEQKRKGQAIDKMVNPPLVAHVSLKNEPASVLPGGVTYAADPSGVGMKPIYEVKPDLDKMLLDIREVQERVRNTFYYDLFMMIAQLETVRTATEIDARREEKLMQLGPVLERDQKEALAPAIQRIYSIMLRKGLLPTPPPELHGIELRIEYISVLAQMQQAVATAGMERLAGFVGNLAGAKPEALDKIDTDELIDQYADKLAVSPKIIVPTDQVLKIRKLRAAQVEQQQNLQNNLAAVQGAKTLSETDTGGGINALQRLVNPYGGPPA